MIQGTGRGCVRRLDVDFQGTTVQDVQVFLELDMQRLGDGS